MQAKVVAAREAQAELDQAARRFQSPKPAFQKREGDVYRRMVNAPETTELLFAGTLTVAALAMQWDVTQASITRSMHAIRVAREIQKLQADWVPDRLVRAMLPIEAMVRLQTLGVDGKDSDEFKELLDVCVRAYTAFSKFFFTLEGRRPVVKVFHQRWIRSVIRAWATGGKQLILSPPRHGKSEMLVRFVVWFIVMNPNIRIGWFCASADVAALMLGAVRDHLENNVLLRERCLPPGDTFRPDLKSGRPWSNKELKVRQQSHVGAKSSSLLALGRTSKFLSRDMDLIVIDDIEDFDSTREEGQRKYSRNKLAEIGTRKEEHTAEVYIGSRQHPDDIPNQLLGLEGSLMAWDTIVDTAHSDDCDLDPDMWDIHIECMLFPEVRSYRWLMEKKYEMEALGLPHAYPMRYLNRPVPEEGQVFDMAAIRENALDRGRGVGLQGLPLGHLAAGLDPSARGIQASFLWHYNNGRMSMIDLDEEQSGGMDGATRVIREWFHTYGLTLWFYETNSQQVDFYDKIRRAVAAEECHICFYTHPEILVKDHNTGTNKKDPELGISAMAPRYHDGRISLPYGTNDARRKVNRLLRQLELWTTDGVKSRKAVTDIKMASWFPFEHFVKMEKKSRVPGTVNQQEGSYRGIERFANVPWGHTQYPGGQ